MKLSVVVPNYNGASTIITTLQSITRQLPEDAEILVVDDCSTDLSITEVARNFPQVKIYQNSENMGAARTRNIGIKQAKGEWMLFVDSDVILKENCLSFLLEARETSDIVFPHILYSNNEIMYPVDEQQAKYLMISTVFLLRRSALPQMVSPSFDETYRVYCEDTDFFLRAYLAGLTCLYQDQAVAVHNVVYKPSNRENRYYLEMRNAIYGAIKFNGIRGLNQFDHAFKLINILKVIACGLFNFNLFDMQARGKPKPKTFTDQIRLLVKKHDQITDKGTGVLLMLTLKALTWNLAHPEIALEARRQVIQQLPGSAGRGR